MSDELYTHAIQRAVRAGQLLESAEQAAEDARREHHEAWAEVERIEAAAALHDLK